MGFLNALFTLFDELIDQYEVRLWLPASVRLKSACASPLVTRRRPSVASDPCNSAFMLHEHPLTNPSCSLAHAPLCLKVYKVETAGDCYIGEDLPPFWVLAGRWLDVGWSIFRESGLAATDIVDPKPVKPPKPRSCPLPRHGLWSSNEVVNAAPFCADLHACSPSTPPLPQLPERL